MLDRPLIFLDLETTGATAHFDRITEIGLIQVDRGNYIGEWSSLVNPGKGIPASIQALTGITDAMVEDAPAFADLAVELYRRLEGRVLVAHNARFDYNFLSSEFRRAGIRYQPAVLCTVKLSRRLFPQHGRHNLDSLIERHGLVCDNRHRALDDARVLWDFIRQIHLNPGPERVQEAADSLLQTPVLPPTLPANALDDVPEGAGAYVFYGRNDAPLYVGKSMNLLGRVMSHFSSAPRSTRDRHIASESTRVEWIETAGELGALIRQVQLVNRLSPAHNRRLRFANDHCAFRWDPVDGPKVPTLIDAGDPDLWNSNGLYGIFRSRHMARNALRELADEQELCHIAIGLEQGKGPCLGYRLKRCRGACVGEESVIAHAMRLTQALQPMRMQSWPFPGLIGIRERDPVTDRSEIHLFDRWCHLGTFDSQADLADQLQTRTEPSFDFDTYKLLRRFLNDKAAGVEIIHLDRVLTPV